MNEPHRGSVEAFEDKPMDDLRKTDHVCYDLCLSIALLKLNVDQKEGQLRIARDHLKCVSEARRGIEC